MGAFIDEVIRAELVEEWRTLWLVEDAERAPLRDYWFNYLVSPESYGSPARHYHNCGHLLHGLREIRMWASYVDASFWQKKVVAKAFWFHDAVYVPNKATGSDEEASARLWESSQIDNSDTQIVADLIRATGHLQTTNATAHPPLKDVLLGADLAILGQTPRLYDAYAAAVRQEYSFAPDDLYRERRALVLRRLLVQAEAGELFGNRYFAARYNNSAIANLTRELRELEGGT